MTRNKLYHRFRSSLATKINQNHYRVQNSAMSSLRQPQRQHSSVFGSSIYLLLHNANCNHLLLHNASCNHLLLHNANFNHMLLHNANLNHHFLPALSQARCLRCVAFSCTTITDKPSAVTGQITNLFTPRTHFASYSPDTSIMSPL